MKFDLNEIATMIRFLTLFALLVTGVAKLFIMDYQISLIGQQVRETNSNVRILIGQSVYDWTVQPGEEEPER